MNRTLSWAGAALAGSTALVVAAALWPSVAGADSSRQRSERVLVGGFTTDRTEEAFLDNDRNMRPSLGDEIVFTNVTRGFLGTGKDYGRCLLHEVTPNAPAATYTTTINCSSVTLIGGSTLTAQGSARITLPGTAAPELLEPAHSAITGGTGRFLRARGDITITAIRGRMLDFETSGRLRLVLAP